MFKILTCVFNRDAANCSKRLHLLTGTHQNGCEVSRGEQVRDLGVGGGGVKQEGGVEARRGNGCRSR